MILWWMFTIVVLSRKETKEGGDALAVLRTVEVVAPIVEVSVLVGVVAGRMVLLFVTLSQASDRHGRYHSGSVDVGQAVGKLVDIDHTVQAVFRLNLSSDPWLSSSAVDKQLSVLVLDFFLDTYS